MKLFNAGSYGRGTIFVSPGVHHPDNTAWVNAQTKTPLMFTVKFKDGVAEVDSDLGRYLIEQGLANRTPLL